MIGQSQPEPYRWSDDTFNEAAGHHPPPDETVLYVADYARPTSCAPSRSPPTAAPAGRKEFTNALHRRNGFAMDCCPRTSLSPRYDGGTASGSKVGSGHGCGKASATWRFGGADGKTLYITAGKALYTST